MSCQNFNRSPVVSQSAEHCRTWCSLDCCRACEAALVAKGVLIDPQTPATKHCPHQHQIHRTPKQQIAVPASSSVFLWQLCGDNYRILATPAHPGPHSSAKLEAYCLRSYFCNDHSLMTRSEKKAREDRSVHLVLNEILTIRPLICRGLNWSRSTTKNNSTNNIDCRRFRGRFIETQKWGKHFHCKIIQF